MVGTMRGRSSGAQRQTWRAPDWRILSPTSGPLTRFRNKPEQRECICIHIGQCGVQIGNAMWELFCIEHGIQFDGRPVSCMGQSDPSKTFFLHSVGEKVIPRVVMVDLEPTVLDEVRVGKFKDLFHPDQLITGKEDAANNYARGRYTVGKEILGSVVGAVRKVVEQCENLQGLMVFNSGGGGTGSGLGAGIKETLAQEYSKKCRLEFVVTSAPEMASSVVEPYNSVLSTHSSRQSDFSNCTFVMDNEALYDICKKKLGIQLPKYQTVNRLLAQVVSSITTSLRFEGVSNVDLIDLHINLVPFPKMHFSITSYAPIINQVKVFHEQLGVGDITSECFKSSNQQVKCDTQKGKFISCCLLYRGDVVPKDINTAVSAIKSRKTLQFVSWCPTGFKIGINSQPPANFPNEEIAKVQRAVCMLANTTAIIDPWSRLGKKFDLLFSKRAFVHWYVSEGMEEEEFIESRCDLEMLYMDYMEIQKDTMSNTVTEDEM